MAQATSEYLAKGVPGQPQQSGTGCWSCIALSQWISYFLGDGIRSLEGRLEVINRNTVHVLLHWAPGQIPQGVFPKPRGFRLLCVGRNAAISGFQKPGSPNLYSHWTYCASHITQRTWEPHEKRFPCYCSFSQVRNKSKWKHCTLNTGWRHITCINIYPGSLRRLISLHKWCRQTRTWRARTNTGWPL